MPKAWSANIVWMGLAYCVLAPSLDLLSTIGLYRGLGVTPWNPAAGLSLAFVYIFGRHAWPFVLAGEVISATFLGPENLSIIVGIVLAVLTSFILIAAGMALRQISDFDPRLRTVQSLLSLLSVSLAAAFVHCIIYIGGLWLTGQISDQQVMPTSWRNIVGDLVGMLIVGPLPILLYSGWRGPRLGWVHAIQLLLLVATLTTIFGYHAASTYQLFYLLFLPVLWIAVRDGMSGATIALNIAQIGIIIGAQMRIEFVPSTGALQALMTALSLTGLLVGAVVTERQSAGQRLRDQHAALGRVLRLRSAGETAAAIAHQINQPLTAISTYATVALDALERTNNEMARSALTKLTAECDRAAAVVRSIRDLVKQGTLVRMPMHMHELVEDLRVAHSTECKLLDITVENAVPSTLPALMADRIQLEQAIDNLLTNSMEAIRETGKGGRVRISAGLVRGDTQISVEDDGPGFAPGLDGIAVTPFMTTKSNGTGLGLAIARSVAEAHGGSLSVEKRNSGACVRLRLPSPSEKSGRENVQVDQHR